MTRSPATRILPAIAICLVATTAVEAGAQTCRGAPRRGGIAYVNGETYANRSNGIALSYAGKRMGIGAEFHSLSENLDVSGLTGSLRFSLLFGASKLQICPGLGLDYRQEDWERSDGSTLTSRHGTGMAGIGLGYEQEVYKGVSVVPFLGVDYHFTGIVFSLDSPGSTDNELSGDTLSHFNIQYGFIAQYKFIYAGMSADRYSDTKGIHPYLARWTVGFNFGGSSRSSSRAPMPRRPSIQSSGRR